MLAILSVRSRQLLHRTAIPRVCFIKRRAVAVSVAKFSSRARAICRAAAGWCELSVCAGAYLGAPVATHARQCVQPGILLPRGTVAYLPSSFICVAPGKHKYKLFSAENARCCLFRREMCECAGNDFQFSHGRAGVTKKSQRRSFPLLSLSPRQMRVRALAPKVGGSISRE
jgi:hypothetical protein